MSETNQIAQGSTLSRMTTELTPLRNIHCGLFKHLRKLLFSGERRRLKELGCTYVQSAQ
jgi:hypothetical protein